MRYVKESSKNKEYQRTPSSKEQKKEEKVNISTPLRTCNLMIIKTFPRTFDIHSPYKV